MFDDKSITKEAEDQNESDLGTNLEVVKESNESQNITLKAQKRHQDVSKFRIPNIKRMKEQPVETVGQVEMEQRVTLGK